MKTIKLVLVLFCAMVVMLSCDSKSGQRKALSPLKSKQQYYLVVELDSIKFMAQTDSISYLFAGQNLKKGDVVRLLQEGTNYTYSAKVISPSQKNAVYYDVYPSMYQDGNDKPKGRFLKDTTSLYLPL